MRPLLALALLLAVPALGADPIGRSRYVTESQGSTASASTLSTQGIPITEAGSCRLLVCAPSGYTLTGGSMVADRYDDEQAKWMALPSTYTETIRTGAQCSPFDDISIGVSSGRMRYRTAGATYVQTADAGTGEADGGPAFVVQTKCWLDRSGGRNIGQRSVVSGTLAVTGTDGGAVHLNPGYVIDPSSVQCMTCASAGSTPYKVTASCAEWTVQSETVHECNALTCTDGGGVPYLVGSRGPRCWNQSATGGADGGATTDKSCWSTSGTGILCWTNIATP